MEVENSKTRLNTKVVCLGPGEVRHLYEVVAFARLNTAQDFSLAKHPIIWMRLSPDAQETSYFVSYFEKLGKRIPGQPPVVISSQGVRHLDHFKEENLYVEGKEDHEHNQSQPHAIGASPA